jgi:UDP-N-acetylmuramate dehydrogenase
MDIYKNLKKFGKVKLKEPLKKHTTFKIGGPADYFVIVDNTDKLIELLQYINEEGLDYFILGGGSNILASDEGYRGVIIKLQNKDIKIEDDMIISDGGSDVVATARFAAENDLSGMEWGICLPGTIGGAVRGNAAYGGVAIADVLEKVEVYRNGEVLEIDNNECDFSNKDSIFKHNSDIILRVWLKLKKMETEEEKKNSKQTMMDQIQYRASSQPGGFSAGCAFKNYVVNEEEKEKLKKIVKEERILNILENYNKIPVGWLVDAVGMKGKKIGGAMVSDQHGNFIMNVDNATAQDVLDLIEEIKNKVYNEFGVEIEEEVQVI